MDLEEPIDVVEVFRQADHLPQHEAEILAMQPLPGVVWLQKGIRNDEFAVRLSEAGIDVVQDACMLERHKDLGLEQSEPA